MSDEPVMPKAGETVNTEEMLPPEQVKKGINEFMDMYMDKSDGFMIIALPKDGQHPKVGGVNIMLEHFEIVNRAVAMTFRRLAIEDAHQQKGK